MPQRVPIIGPSVWQRQGVGCQPARQRERGLTVAHSAGLASVDDKDSLRQPSELQRLINSIPYRKLFLWSLVGLFAWPLHEFFGVSGGGGSTARISMGGLGKS